MTSLVLALRRFANRPWSTAAMVLMLAIGIGASVAVFSFLEPALLRPMGIPDVDRVVTVYRLGHLHFQGQEVGTYSRGLDLEEIRQSHAALLAVANVNRERFLVRPEGQESRSIVGVFITSEYFEVMGAKLHAGNPFSQTQDQVSPPVVILSHSLAQRLFGSQALGQSLRINGITFTVTGIAPPNFTGHRMDERMDIWLPAGSRALLAQADREKGFGGDQTFARLRPGISRAQAEAALRVACSGFAPKPDRFETNFDPIQAKPFLDDRMKVLENRLPAPWLMLAVCGGLLLLACANVANLQLAQMESRRCEFSTRLAMGAPRRAILRQVLGENLLLAILGGASGLFLAQPIMQLLRHVRDVKVYVLPLEVNLNWDAVLFALLLVLLSTFIVGMVPAWRASRADVMAALKESASTTTRGTRLKDGLVILQVALALALVCAGTLVTRGLNRARHTDLGFRSAGVAGIRMEFPSLWNKERKLEALQILQGRVQGLPGIRAVCYASGLPMEDGDYALMQIEDTFCRIQPIGPGYFKTLGIPLRRGRELDALDTDKRVVNQAYVQHLHSGQDPLAGTTGTPNKVLGQVIGVVADHGVSSDAKLHEPVVFVSMTGSYFSRGSSVCLLLRSDGNPKNLFPALRQMVHEVDPEIAVLQMTTLDDHLDGLFHDLRVASWMLGFCGIVSLCLSAMGVQSLLAFRVSRQSREIGLRMALGAQRGQMLFRVVLRGMVSVVLGLLLGSLVADWLGRSFHALFNGVDPLNPGSLSIAVLVMLGASLLACLGPALRAASIDPAKALREE